MVRYLFRILLVGVGSALSGYTDPRSQWMLNLTHVGSAIEMPWPALSPSEMKQLAMKADGWLEHSVQTGVTGHIQWGQAMPQVIYADAARKSPYKYDDVGDTAMWTGTLLGAIVHAYAVDGTPSLLPVIGSILQGLNFSTASCHSSPGYIPRTWALPAQGELPWLAWRSYFSPSPPYINGNGSHGVFSCTAKGSQDWLWQGDSSRDTYIGALFGLASTLLVLKEGGEYELAQQVFERIFDKLSADRFFILPPDECKPIASCPPVNPTPTFAAAFLRVALTVNPTKYANHTSAYTFWLDATIKSETITPIHHSAYYGNNLLAECWYLIVRFERRDDTPAAAGRWPKLAAKMIKLLNAYAPHLQANLPSYLLAAMGNGTTDGTTRAVESTAGAMAAENASLWNSIVEATLWDFPPAPHIYHHVDQHNNSIYGPDVKCSEGSGCATTAILVRDRPPNEFVWQIDPTKLAAGPSSDAQPITSFGGAFLAPYHIWRSKGRI
jgi:hypothetical protein